MDYAPHYDTRNDTQRAEALPKSFGHDNPEVIRLMEIRDAAAKDHKAEFNLFSEFDHWRCNLAVEIEQCYCQIVEIDRRRPQHLVDLFIAGGDFAKDDEEQQRRAELEKQVERYKLAQPLLANKRANLEQRTQEVHRRHSKACQDVDALLARLRLDHVTEMRR